MWQSSACCPVGPQVAGNGHPVSWELATICWVYAAVRSAAKRERKKTSYADDDDWRPSKNRSLSRGSGKGSRSGGGGDDDSDEDYEDEEPSATPAAATKPAVEASEADPDEKLRLKLKDIKCVGPRCCCPLPT